jgi:hypothetical protein
MNADLPAFVVMTPSLDRTQGPAQALYSRLWGPGFLPSEHQGVALRSAGDPVLFLGNPPGVDGTTRRAMLDALGAMNERRRGARRSGGRRPHRAVRDGVPHAELGARAHRLCAANRSRRSKLYGPEVHQARDVRQLRCCWRAG